MNMTRMYSRDACPASATRRREAAAWGKVLNVAPTDDGVVHVRFEIHWQSVRMLAASGASALSPASRPSQPSLWQHRLSRGAQAHPLAGFPFEATGLCRTASNPLRL
jgi:hypothetical protein